MDEFRVKKVQKLRAAGKNPYPAKYERTHTMGEASKLTADKKVAIAGRVMLIREMGKITFATLQDSTGRMQIAFKEEELKEQYKDVQEYIDLGDIIGVAGTFFLTKKGEPTILVKEWTMLNKALRQPPEKWHGVKDRETAYRQRYLDLMSNNETLERFFLRSRFIRALREFYWKQDFVEVDLPVLVNEASGALATPFSTHHDALNLDVYLRIALETHQKECLVGGLDRTFSIGPVFRNEGMDPSHLQEFTMCEHYASYWDYENNMAFTETMFKDVIKKAIGTTKAEIPNREGETVKIDFGGTWSRISLAETIKQHCDIDITTCNTANDLLKEIARKNIKLDVDISSLERGNLIDQLYKKVSRPHIVEPTFITQHPVDLSPLARRNDENPEITDRFQLVVGGWEIVNAYSELIDPVDQANRFEEQSKAKLKGDHDAHDKDDAFVTALEYGCPPCSGWGMGIDRIVALLSKQENLKDVVLFPLMKPLEHGEKENDKNLGSPSQSAKPTISPSSPLLLQHSDYGHLLGPAHGLIEQHTDQTKIHLLSTGEAMAMLAKKFSGDEKTWRVAGMLHDLDWDKLDKDYEAHCGDTLEHLLSEIESPSELLADIRAHYVKKYGGDYPLDSMLRKCLYCVDELTGFIVAVTLVRPSRKIADVEVRSVKKKMKDKSFAAQVDREQIKKCEELLNISLDEFIEITLDAMKGIADQLDL